MNPGTIAAIYTFCAHYHSGQWSRGYRILCRADDAEGNGPGWLNVEDGQ